MQSDDERRLTAMLTWMREEKPGKEWTEDDLYLFHKWFTELDPRTTGRHGVSRADMARVVLADVIRAKVHREALRPRVPSSEPLPRPGFEPPEPEAPFPWGSARRTGVPVPRPDPRMCDYCHHTFVLPDAKWAAHVQACRSVRSRLDAEAEGLRLQEERARTRGCNAMVWRGHSDAHRGDQLNREVCLRDSSWEVSHDGREWSRRCAKCFERDQRGYSYHRKLATDRQVDLRR